MKRVMVLILFVFTTALLSAHPNVSDYTLWGDGTTKNDLSVGNFYMMSSHSSNGSNILAWVLFEVNGNKKKVAIENTDAGRSMLAVLLSAQNNKQYLAIKRLSSDNVFLEEFIVY